jgi:hypothetical protein
MEERLFSNPRELKFGGEGKAESIKRGFAITTLRNPRPEYNFVEGEIIEANCFKDKEKVSVVVIADEIMPLNRQLIPVLALDGYFSAEQAADDLKNLKGYEKTTRVSLMQAIVFISAEEFDSLSQKTQYDLTHEPINDLLKDRNLRHLFFPTMCEHCLDFGGVQDWVDFLSVHKLISAEEKSRMENYKYRGMKDTQRLLNDHPELFRGISLDSTHPAFKPLVLGIFDK